MELAFGDFRLDTSRRMLWHAQTYVPLGDRSYTILNVLLESAGRLVTKAELFERAWPGLMVEPANLRVQIANLRKVLGELGQKIVTEQSLGYRFNVDIRRLTEPEVASKRFSIPTGIVTPLGREREVASALEALADNRLVSIVGPGGIGKTTLALDVASLAADRFQDGVCFVDLSLISDPAMVAIAVASALERPVMSEPATDVRTYLRTRRLLLVMDCCERVIEPSAELAASILAEAPGVRILATSREAMRVAGERVERLEGLSLPREEVGSVEQASAFGAIALFNRTAKSANSSFQLDDANLSTVMSICRKLDGIPLAIDLAAGLSGSLGLKHINDGLAQRISILTFGRRGGLTRHRTLDATIAWSHEMLGVAEAITLRRLSIFADAFTMADALGTVAFDGLDKTSASESIVSLAQKSLLNVERQDDRLVYRLLETTRHFAANELEKADERDRLASNHAVHVTRLLNTMSWDQFDVVAERRLALGLVKQVREALEWANARADPSVAVSLTLAAERLLLELGLYAEHGERMKQAERMLQTSDISDERSHAALLTGIAYGVLYESMDTARIEIVFDAMRRSRAIGERQLYMRNLFYAYYFYVVRHRSHEALELAKLLLDEARDQGESALVVFATINMAVAHVQLGNWRLAREILERYIDSSPSDPPRSVAIFYGFNIDAVAHFVLATIDCLEGNSIRAFELIERALFLTEENRHEQTRFQVLFFGACCLSFISSDWVRARRYLDMLERHARDYAPWQFMASSLKGWLAYEDGRFQDASSLLEPFCALDVPCASMTAYFFLLLSAVRRQLGDLKGAEQLAVNVMERRTGSSDPFMVGPSLKARADILMASGQREDIREAAESYREAMQLARANGAIVMEIPAAAALARLQISRGNFEEARDILMSIISRAPRGPDLSPIAEVRALLAGAALCDGFCEQDLASLD